MNHPNLDAKGSLTRFFLKIDERRLNLQEWGNGPMFQAATFMTGPGARLTKE